MEAASCLLFALGCLGATDIALYHSVAHGIRSHPDSRAELVTHSLRGPTYAALFVLVPNFVLYGAYFWCLIALFALEVAISICDFALERRSRQFLGGLPSGEYVLHTVMAMFFGALVTAVCFGAGDWARLPTQVRYAPAEVPTLLRYAMGVMAVLVFVSGVQDGVAVIRLHGRKSRSNPTA
jgi:hypothetical protein